MSDQDLKNVAVGLLLAAVVLGVVGLGLILLAEWLT